MRLLVLGGSAFGYGYVSSRSVYRPWNDLPVWIPSGHPYGELGLHTGEPLPARPFTTG